MSLKKDEISCKGCGGCRNAKGDIFLSPLDLYRIGCHLHLPVRDIIQTYCTFAKTNGIQLPQVKMKTKVKGRKCVFYNNGCAIKAARPYFCEHGHTDPQWQKYMDPLNGALYMLEGLQGDTRESLISLVRREFYEEYELAKEFGPQIEKNCEEILNMIRTLRKISRQKMAV